MFFKSLARVEVGPVSILPDSSQAKVYRSRAGQTRFTSQSLDRFYPTSQYLPQKVTDHDVGDSSILTALASSRRDGKDDVLAAWHARKTLKSIQS